MVTGSGSPISDMDTHQLGCKQYPFRCLEDFAMRGTAMIVHGKDRLAPLTMLTVTLFGGCLAGCTVQSSSGLQPSASLANSETPPPLTLKCETPDAGLLAAMTQEAAAATIPGSTIELSNPSVVDAGAGQQAFSFSWIGRSGDIGQNGPLKTYVAKIGDNNPSTWQEIPYDTAIVDPYGKHPELSQDDENILLAAHAALRCMMGG